MKFILPGLVAASMLSGCVSLYRPVEAVRPSDQELSCEELHDEFMRFNKKENKIAADAESLTGNRYTEYLIYPAYLLFPPLILSRGSGGATHKVSEAELSYICRQKALISRLRSKSCELRNNEKGQGSLGKCKVSYE